MRGLALQAVVLLPFIDLAELQTALEKIPDFFGYSAQGGEGGEGAAPDGTPEGMHQWLEDEVAGAASGSGAAALFKRLDADGDGQVDFDEFYSWFGSDKASAIKSTTQNDDDLFEVVPFCDL